MVHFSISALLNTLNLKVNSFVPYYTHTIECVQYISGMPNMESLGYGGENCKTTDCTVLRSILKCLR